MIEYIHLTILNSLKERFADLMDGKRLHIWFECSGNKGVACHGRILDLRRKKNLHTKGMASFLIITTFSEILLESNPNSRTLKSGLLCICNTSWPASHYSLTIRSVISNVVPKCAAGRSWACNQIWQMRIHIPKTQKQRHMFFFFKLE
jgi:hypothetical protein